MPGIITLNVVQREVPETLCVFDGPARCIVGRAEDCDIQITGRYQADVSRHHCCLEVDPPTIRVRDLGSLNGTYVNGQLVGRRLYRPLKEAGVGEGAAHELKDGDEVGVGHLRLLVWISSWQAPG
jgi:pSer/pThr/pTyr-binding forkhead associated (FHA) protein